MMPVTEQQEPYVYYYAWNYYNFNTGREDLKQRYTVFNIINHDIAEYFWSKDYYTVFNYFLDTFGEPLK